MIGIDIVKIERIVEAMKNKRFLDRILNESEKEYALNKSKEITKEGFDSVAMTVAGLFASKEAVLKALGVGMKGGYAFKDIEILHDNMGAPVVKLSPKLAKVARNKSVHVSIAHDGKYAVANAILLG